MTGLNHAAIGALVAVAVKQPAVALPLALSAHFAVDAIPHWSYKITDKLRKIIMRTDLVLSLTLLTTLAVVLTAPGWLVIACGLLCMAPDAMWLPEILQGKPPVIHKSTLVGYMRQFHRKIQWKEFANGLYLEAIWFAMVLALILKIGR
jgi:hypothetical protein